MKFSKLQLAAAAVATIGTLLAVPAHAGKTLDAIKARGQVVCGVNTGLAGFAAADSSGKWSGLDIDVCKALAAATLVSRHPRSRIHGGAAVGVGVPSGIQVCVGPGAEAVRRAQVARSSHRVAREENTNARRDSTARTRVRTRSAFSLPSENCAPVQC